MSGIGWGGEVCGSSRVGVGGWYRVGVSRWYMVGVAVSVIMQPCMDAPI